MRKIVSWTLVYLIMVGGMGYLNLCLVWDSIRHCTLFATPTVGDEQHLVSEYPILQSVWHKYARLFSGDHNTMRVAD